MKKEEVVEKAKNLNPRVVGVYSILSMKNSAIWFAKQLSHCSDLMIAGGPLPTTSPEIFLDDFDIAVIGEGEETVLNILKSLDNKNSLFKVDGIAYRKNEKGPMVLTNPRKFRENLDSLPFPARDLFDHEAYQKYFRKHHSYTITSMITSRGCPFDCDFCSRPVFGKSYRCRSPANIADEIESIIPYNYDRIWISDDIFPINQKTGISTCDEIIDRKIDIDWECLCRADIMNREIAAKMKRAGCYRVFFGLESGNNGILKVMKKRLSVEQAERAVRTIKSAGIKVGAFFIIGYPGETDETMLDTIKFASSLPLDYLSFTVPYPIPGTGLFKKLKGEMTNDEWKKPRYDPVKHVLLYESEFSMGKLKFGIMKATIQHNLRKQLNSSYTLLGEPFEFVTDNIFRVLK
jgi:anaerobic magnesium-protoporphyrin IX monomethyl ester cyclase